MIRTWLGLRRGGVMGLNERNLTLINEYNPRRLMRLVDDKRATKKLAEKAGIPTPELYGVISNATDMRRLPDLVSRDGGVAIKPANGSQGNGILVLGDAVKGGWRLASGRKVTLDDLTFHVNNIISGMYSLSGQPDVAMVEARVHFAGVFNHIAFQGVPDIRIIVLKGVPILGMVRLPTAQSDGKANLHRGGVGVGLDLVRGVTMKGMQHGRSIAAHPDTANPLDGVEVPHWDEMLLMAARAYDVTGLGYLGADIVLDRDKGPLLLELNARPGLAIQVANQIGLKRHVDAALAVEASHLSAGERVKLAKRLYTEVADALRAERDKTVAAASSAA